jgi:Ca2+-transporting ATPase
MERPPRNPEESVLTRTHWSAIAGYGVVIAVAILGSYYLARQWLGMTQEQAVTVSFMTLGFSRLWHVFNMRDRNSGYLRNEITQNPYVWGALLFCTGLLLIAVYVPLLSTALETANPGGRGWLLIIAMSFVPLIVGQIFKALSEGKSEKAS